jgi:GT2 family glycosyltransferase
MSSEGGNGSGKAGPVVCLVILNWMNYEGTAGLLASLPRQSHGDLDVVLVDGGSPEGSGERLSAEFPRVDYLGLEDNNGYAAGNNAGIKRALERGADLVLVLNPDLTILSPRLVEKMAACFFKDPGLGILNPLIYHRPPPTEKSNRRFVIGPYFRTIRKMLLLAAGSETSTIGDQRLEERPYAFGCAMMISRACLEAVGFLNEEFFMYGVEPEFCFRALRKGWRTMALMDEEASVLHPAGPEEKPWKVFFDKRNQFLFLRLFGPWRQALLLAVFLGSLVRDIFPLAVRSRWEMVRFNITGFFSGLRLWAGDLANSNRPGEWRRIEKEMFSSLGKTGRQA